MGSKQLSDGSLTVREVARRFEAARRKRSGVSLSLLLFVLVAATVFGSRLQAQVVINEVVASNVESLMVGGGETPDWIELKNTGTEVVDLGGWSLSDDPDEPFKWTLPSVLLPAGGFQLVLASGLDRSLFANEWNTIVDLGDVWRYFDGVSEPDADWFSPGYDDSSWPEGPSGFGFGDDDDATETIGQSVYLRHRFDLVEQMAAQTTAIYFHIDADDGFVVYLNGLEVGRRNLGYVGDPTTFDQLAGTRVEARIYRGIPANGFVIEALSGLLLEGENVLCVEVHNADDAPPQSDLTAIPILSLGRSTEEGNKDVSPFIALAETELHTNFKLSSDGETLTLTDPSGVQIDDVSFGEMRVDDSLGWTAELSERLVFDEPTPGAENTTEGRPGYSADPILAPASGIYAQPVTVTVDGELSGGGWFYTLDASEPTALDNQYAGPFTVAGNTNLVRVRHIETGLWPSRIVSASYIKPYENAGLATLSIVMDPDDLFDEDTGIYVEGDDASPVWPYYGANFWEDWERPGHVDLIEPSGVLGVSADGGVKIHGGTTRASDQRSLRLLMRGGYGDDSVDYPVFEVGGSGSFNRLIFRNSGQDWLETHLRDAWAHRAFEHLGLLVQAYRPAVTFLNGTYWGLYNIREFQNDYYIEQKTGEREFDLIRRNGEVLAGDLSAWLEIERFLNQNDLSNQANFDFAAEQIDIENYTDWFILNVYLTNTDWPQNNTRRWRARNAGSRWQWLLWDLDFGMGWLHPPEFKALERALVGARVPDESRLVATSLLENPGYETEFINRYSDHLNVTFDPDTLNGLLDEMTASIEPLIEDHQIRWGQSREDWDGEVDAMRDWLALRPAEARDNLAEYFGLGGTWQLEVRISPQQSGWVDLAAVTIDGPFEGEYFFGVPVTLTARPQPGFEFSHWESPSGLRVEEATITVDPQTDLRVTAQFVEGEPEPRLVVNEINYNSGDNFDPGDWVEILNVGERRVTLSGWTIRDDDDEHVFDLPAFQLPVGAHLVIAADLASFSFLFPEVEFVVGELDFGFGGGGDSVRLFDSEGSLHFQVDYDDEAPWPTEPDGDGPTLELIDPDLDPADPNSWQASVAAHGTPGQPNG